MADNNNQQLQIELKPEVAEGTYSNLAILTHSSSEFVADFIQMMPGMQKAQVRSRIIMAPEHAKRLLMALQSAHGFAGQREEVRTAVRHNSFTAGSAA